MADIPKLQSRPDPERITLGAAYVNESQEQLAQVVNTLNSDDFTTDFHRAVYSISKEIHERGEIPHPSLLIERLKSRRQYKKFAAEVGKLADGIPRTKDLGPYFNLIKEASLQRKITRLTDSWFHRASSDDCNVTQLVNEISEALPSLDLYRDSTPQSGSLALSWDDFSREEFKHGEPIGFAVERGEIALMISLPSGGKTTLALNASLSKIVGHKFPPIVNDSEPRCVLYVDGETRRARLQRDLELMTGPFSREEAILAGQNLHIVCEPEVNNESLALTRPDHLLRLTQEALRVKADLIIIDTLASLWPVFNENDNAEQQRRIWQPLQKLARQTNAAILVLHHVGKRSEDSQSPERVYRGRGASASGAFARAVWILTPDPAIEGVVTLSCVKAKGEKPADVRLQLDKEKRWFRISEQPAEAQVTTYQRILQAVTHEMGLTEIILAVAQHKIGRRTIQDQLSEAVELGHLQKIRHGVYAPLTQSAESAESATERSAPSALLPDENETDSAKVQASKGAAFSALSPNSARTNGLSRKTEVESLKADAFSPLKKRHPKNVSTESAVVQPPMASTLSALSAEDSEVI